MIVQSKQECFNLKIETMEQFSARPLKNNLSILQRRDNWTTSINPNEIWDAACVWETNTLDRFWLVSRVFEVKKKGGYCKMVFGYDI